MRKAIAGVLVTCVAAWLGACMPPPAKTLPPEAMPLVFQASFDEARTAWKAVDRKTPVFFKTGKERRAWERGHWLATDAAAWKIAREGANGFLSLHKQSTFEP